MGATSHQEYWIPAEDLDDFNGNIVGLIEVVHEFRGQQEHDADSTLASGVGVNN